MSLETVECEQCGDSFTAYSDAQAAQNGYCCPRCESKGKALI